MRVKLKGLNSVSKQLADGTTRTYWYAYKGGPPLRGEPGTPEFISSFNEACAAKIAPPAGALLALLFRFQESAEFQHGIEERTRRDYIRQIERIEESFGDFPIKALADPTVHAPCFSNDATTGANVAVQADYAYGTLARVVHRHTSTGCSQKSMCPWRQLYARHPCPQIWHDEDVSRFLRTARHYLQLASAGCRHRARQGDLLRLPWSAMTAARSSCGRERPEIMFRFRWLMH